MNLSSIIMWAFREFVFWKIIVSGIADMIVCCCFIHCFRTKDFSIKNWFAWLKIPAFRASLLYWRLRKVRKGEMVYERFVDEYTSVHIKDHEIGNRESRREHAKSVHWNKVFRELVNHRRDLVEKYMMGPKFSYEMYKQLMSELNLSDPYVISNGVEPEVKIEEHLVSSDKDYGEPCSTTRRQKNDYNTLNDIKTLKAPDNMGNVLSSYFRTHRMHGWTIWGVILALQELEYVVSEDVDMSDYMRVFRTEGFITNISDNGVYNAINREPGGENSHRIDVTKKSIKQLFE